MPLLTTLGSLYETKQAPPLPLNVSALSLSRSTGYNLIANYTEQFLNPPPYDYPITYYGKLKSSPNRYTSTTTSNSTMTFTRVPPFDTYNATVWASTVIGNSSGVVSGNIFVSSNLVANGNTVITNAYSLTINPSGTEVDIGTTTGRLLRYSRNTTTGQLTLLSNTFIANGVIDSMIYSTSGNYLYLYGNTGQTIYKYDISSNAFNQTGLSNVSRSSPIENQLFDGGTIATGRVAGSYCIITYTADANGNLTYANRVADGSNYTGPGNYRPYFNTRTNYMVIGHSGTGNAQMNLYNISGTTIAFRNRYTFFLSSNNTSTIANTSIVANSIYVTLSNTISNQLRSFSYTSNLMTAIQTSNVASEGYIFCPVEPQSNSDITGVYYNGNITGQRNGNGVLTILSNSASYSANFLTRSAIPSDTNHVYVLNGSTLTVYNVTS
jgi:hypothetical protein